MYEERLETVPTLSAGMQRVRDEPNLGMVYTGASIEYLYGHTCDFVVAENVASSRLSALAIAFQKNSTLTELFSYL